MNESRFRHRRTSTPRAVSVSFKWPEAHRAGGAAATWSSLATTIATRSAVAASASKPVNKPALVTPTAKVVCLKENRLSKRNNG